MTRELKEQQALLQATRAELQRLKQSSLSATAHSTHSASSSSFQSSTPPPALTPLSTSDKKQSNNVGTEAQPMQAKRRLEDLIRKVSVLFFFYFADDNNDYIYIYILFVFCFFQTIGANTAFQCKSRCPGTRFK